MKTFKDMARTGEVKRADVGMKVKLEDIHPEPDFNVRARDERLEQHIEDIKQFILNGGQLPPIECRPREEGGVWVVDGHCRREAYERAVKEGAPIEWIGVMPFHGNDADRIARMATSNEGLKLTPLETAAVYKRLRGMGLEIPEIAKLVNRSPQHVGHVLTLADADTDVQQAVAAGDVKASVAIGLVKKHGEKAGAKIIELKDVAKSRGKKRVTASVADKKVKLTTNEAKALDMFISANHEKWKEVAEGFLEPDERRNLEARLAQDD